MSRSFARTAATPDELLAGPIRGELLGAEHLAERARASRAPSASRPAHAPAGAAPGPARRDPRASSTRRTTGWPAAADREVNVGPAGEWLLDNFHVVQEHIREVRESLPRGYYRELPELASGALAGYPRVYEIAITLISHTEARIELENVDLFVGAFQEVRAARRSASSGPSRRCSASA